MAPDIYSFSLECAELLNGVNDDAEIFIRLVSAYYLAINFPPERRLNVTQDEIYENLKLVNKIMPGPEVRANFLYTEKSGVVGVITEKMLALDRNLFTGNPGIIGWAYQYYNQKRKDAVYKQLRKNIKISGDSLAPATQIFTPKWIARYLTENAIGRISAVRGVGRYIIQDSHKDSFGTTALDLSESNFLDMKVLDPCMGCGHILLAAFEVLMDLYVLAGYSRGEAALHIITDNLYGLDVDEQAVKIGRFALIMKAAVYAPDLLDNEPELNLFSFEDCTPEERELGSLLEQDEAKTGKHKGARKALSQKYDVIVTNPPYMGNHNMSSVLSGFVKENYPLSKTDLSTVFMERAFKLCKPRGSVAMININSWLYLPTYEGFREYLIKNKTFFSMLDLGQGAFERGNISRTVAFVMANSYEPGYMTVFSKMYDRKEEQISEVKKEMMFFEENRRYYCKAESFLKIPKKIFAYALNDRMIDIMNNSAVLSSCGKPRQGLKTGDNAKFVRLWHEVPRSEICFNAASREDAVVLGCKWFPYNKAGEYRKWYGNNRYIVNWENDGAEIRGFRDANGKLRSRPQNMNYFFKSSVSWNMISNDMSARFIPEGFIFDGAGGGIFSQHNHYLLGYLNSCVAKSFLEVTSQSINYNVGQIADLPMIISKARYDEVVSIVSRCIELSKEDWDECEESWDFKEHPLIEIKRSSSCGFVDLAGCYEIYKKSLYKRYDALKCAEEKLDVIFLEIYRLPDLKFEEAKPTVKKADIKNDIKRLVSYAVGCMFGRFDCAGFEAVEENSIDISGCLLSLFVKFLEAAFGRGKLTENMSFIAAALNGNKNCDPETVLREYFSKGFLKDHEKIYLKHPIYFLHPDHPRALIYKLKSVN